MADLKKTVVSINLITFGCANSPHHLMRQRVSCRGLLWHPLYPPYCLWSRHAAGFLLRFELISLQGSWLRSVISTRFKGWEEANPGCNLLPLRYPMWLPYGYVYLEGVSFRHLSIPEPTLFISYFSARDVSTMSL
jgi:hypothetical protein